MIRYKNTLAMGAAVAIAMAAGSTSARAELTGSVSLDMNSHFISYGLDVWAAGDEPRWTFNPSVSIDYAIDDQWTFSTGFWLDVNSNASPNADVVETDIWAGFSYNAGLATLSATFQNWQYGGLSEEVLDLGISLDTFLSPSLTLHKRLDPGASGGFNGWFAVLGGSHSFDVTPEFSVSVPVSVGFAINDFHTTMDGYGFASAGLQGSYAVNDQVSINGGVTYWDTDAGVTGNADNGFFAYNLGVAFSF